MKGRRGGAGRGEGREGRAKRVEGLFDLILHEEPLRQVLSGLLTQNWFK